LIGRSSWGKGPGCLNDAPVHEFRVGDGLVDVRGACRRYLSLLEQLVRDFIQTFGT